MNRKTGGPKRFLGSTKYKRAVKKYAKRYSKKTASKYYKKKGTKIPRKKLGLKVKGAVRRMLSQCSAHYVESQYNPFKQYSPGVCVPDFLSMPSYKFSTKMRGTGQLNANGFGYVVLNPYIPANGPDLTETVTNNQNWLAPVWVSNNGAKTVADQVSFASLATSTTLKTVVDVNATPNYWDSSISAVSFKAAMLGDGNYDWRPVSAGIKIKYSGNVMNRKGTIVLFQDPQNSEWLYNKVNVAQNDFLKYEEAAYSALGEQEYAVTYHPRNLGDLTYASEWFDVVPLTFFEIAKYGVIAMMIYGGPANESFVFEAVEHWEMTGSAVPSRTLSHSDPNGFSSAQAVIPTKPTLNTPFQESKTKLDQAENQLATMSGTNLDKSDVDLLDMLNHMREGASEPPSVAWAENRAKYESENPGALFAWGTPTPNDDPRNWFPQESIIPISYRN